VVGGFLSPSHDEYVLRKLGKDWIPSSHRYKLIELALQHSSWISLSQWEGSQPKFTYFDKLLDVHAAYLRQSFPDQKLQLIFICGADLAVNNRLVKGCAGYPVVAVGRHSYTQHLQNQVSNNYHEKGLFFLIEEELENISSTIIRKRLQEKNGDLEEFMHPDAAQYYRNMELNVQSYETEKENEKENAE